MTKRMLPCAIAAVLAAPAVVSAPSYGYSPHAYVEPGKVPAEMREAKIDPKLGTQVDPALQFRDETGAPVPLSAYFKSGRPVLLSLMYYECPMLCGLVLNGMLEGLKGLDWVPGKQFEVVSVSINPREGPDLAAKKKKAVMAALGKEGADWHFLTGDEKSIKALASQVGFGYRYVESQKEFAHGAGLFLLTPDGRLSRVLFGIRYPPRDLRLGLLEASNGKIGTIVDRVMLFCFQYDPDRRGYSFYAFRIVQAGGLAMVLGLATWLGVFHRRERRASIAMSEGGRA